MKSILILAAVLAITAFNAKAQTTVYNHDGGRNMDSSRTTYSDGSTSTTEDFYDRNGSLETTRRTSTKPTVVAPTPSPAPVSAPAYATHVSKADALALNDGPVRPATVQPSVIVVPVSAAEMHAASIAGAARVKAQNDAAAAAKESHKKSVLKNGE